MAAEREVDIFQTVLGGRVYLLDGEIACADISVLERDSLIRTRWYISRIRFRYQLNARFSSLAFLRLPYIICNAFQRTIFNHVPVCAVVQQIVRAIFVRWC